MQQLNLSFDDFADYGIVVEHVDYPYFIHRPCGYKEHLDATMEYFPIKFLMVKAAEHQMKEHPVDG